LELPEDVTVKLFSENALRLVPLPSDDCS
jgi:hypothetical protein